jgi:hypothetical protein
MTCKQLCCVVHPLDPSQAYALNIKHYIVSPLIDSCKNPAASIEQDGCNNCTSALLVVRISYTQLATE